MIDRIHLPRHLIDRCQQFGIDVENRVNNHSPMPEARKKELQRDVQWDAKGAECALAIHQCEDPHVVVDWNVRTDIRFNYNPDLTLHDQRFEVKNAPIGSRYLFWPEHKWEKYDRFRFDWLVLVTGALMHGYEVTYFVDKQGFKERCKIANGWHPHGLWRGTPYIDVREDRYALAG